jgi:hypothetical protein
MNFSYSRPHPHPHPHSPFPSLTTYPYPQHKNHTIMTSSSNVFQNNLPMWRRYGRKRQDPWNFRQIPAGISKFGSCRRFQLVSSQFLLLETMSRYDHRFQHGSDLRIRWFITTKGYRSDPIVSEARILSFPFRLQIPALRKNTMAGLPSWYAVFLRVTSLTSIKRVYKTFLQDQDYFSMIFYCLIYAK